MLIKIKYYNYNLFGRKRVFLQTHNLVQYNLVHTIVQFMDGYVYLKILFPSFLILL